MHDFPPLSAALLRAIAEHGPITVAALDTLPELAQQLPASGCRGAVLSLFQNQYLEGERVDWRPVEYAITSKGRRALTRIGQAPSGQVALPRRGAMSGAYDGRELRPFAGRTRAMDAFTFPSVVNGEPVVRSRPILIGARPENRQ